MIYSSLCDKVALITGSSYGIGYEIARKFVCNGAKVVVNSRNQKNIDKSVKQLRAYAIGAGYSDTNVVGIPCSVSNPEQRKQLIDFTLENYNRIDIFVSNAATSPINGGLMKCTDSLFDRVMDVNVKSTFSLTRMVASHMQMNSSPAVILYISSILALHPSAALGVYSVSKHALTCMCRVFAQELAAYNIRVNAIAPGFVDTHFSAKLLNSETTRNTIFDSIYMKRVAQPAEIATIAAFLCSAEASYITGSVFPVDGGTGDVFCSLTKSFSNSALLTSSGD